jgi:hypothetical protein
MSNFNRSHYTGKDNLLWNCMNPLLLYKTQARVSLDEHQRDIEAVVTPLSGYDFDADEVHQNHVQLGRPEGRLAKAIAAQLSLPASWDLPEVVACRLAGPHSDIEWLGKAFVSVVLHTGPHPYQVSAFSCTPRTERTAAQVHRTGRLVEPGEVFVFDPAQGHCAFPLCPDRKSLLVLLQWTVDLEGEGALANLRTTFPV